MPLDEQLSDRVFAYVLGALDAVECATFEDRLRHDPELRELVAEYRSVVDFLPLATRQVNPPPELKRRILEAVSAKPVRPFSPRRWFLSPTFAAIAAVVLLGLGLSGIMLQRSAERQTWVVRARETEFKDAMEIVAAAEGPPRPIKGTDAAPNAAGRFYTARNGTQAALVINGLPALAPGKAYQFWLVDPGGDRTSGGVFTVDTEGRAWLYVRIPQALANYQSVGITIEPLSGSPSPTGARVAAGLL